MARKKSKIIPTKCDNCAKKSGHASPANAAIPANLAEANHTLKINRAMDIHALITDNKRLQEFPRQQMLNIFSSLLILLWVYTAGSKLLALGEFEKELKNQVFGDGLAISLLWLLPSVELLAAALLLFSRTAKIGFTLSTLLMGAFTAYIALVLTGYFQQTPCSCGGVLKELGWQAHLWFNFFFLSISAIGIWLSKRITSSKPRPNPKLSTNSKLN